MHDSPRALADEYAVIRAITELARAQDDRDWRRFQDAFTDEILISVPSLPEPREMRTADYLPFARRALEGYDVTHHQVTNHVVEVAGDRAVAGADLRAVHQLAVDGEPRELTVGGRYRFVLVNERGGWRIRERSLTVRYMLGDPAVAERARQRFDEANA